MPTPYTQKDGDTAYVTHIPNWEKNSEGGVYSSYEMAYAVERSFEKRTGIKIDSGARLRDLRRADPEDFRASSTWNRALLQALMEEDLRVATEKEQAYQRDVLGWPEDMISGERFWREFREAGERKEAKDRRTLQPAKRTPFSPELKDQVWLKTDGHCAYCGIPLLPFTNFTIDHVHPFSDGGADTYDNLVPCCKTCNSRKHAMPIETFRGRCGGGLFWIEKNGGTFS